MTEFKLETIQKVIIQEISQDDLENFLYICRISNIPNAIWVDGMIILLVTAHATEKNTERFFEGSRIYERVIFVKYPKYSKTAKGNGGSYELALRNYMNIPRFREFAKWIKSQSCWNIEPEKLK